jgi:peptide-methionine (S)-S-oxide reductase
MRRDAIVIFAMLLFTINTMGQVKQNQEKELATFGGGCFWCVEAIYERVRGLSRVESGYSGGHVKNPSYREISTGETGHAEVVQLEYDPEQISFAALLEIFFKTHDPTTLNRQGADVGTQYRSTILYHSEEQRETAQRLIGELDQAGIWNNPIVTTLEPLKEFYSAEKYHQEYYENNPNQGYCRMVIQPKVDKFEALFREFLKQEE